jgi:hypothetical protein
MYKNLIQKNTWKLNKNVAANNDTLSNKKKLHQKIIFQFIILIRRCWIPTSEKAKPALNTYNSRNTLNIIINKYWLIDDKFYLFAQLRINMETKQLF